MNSLTASGSPMQSIPCSNVSSELDNYSDEPIEKKNIINSLRQRLMMLESDNRVKDQKIAELKQENKVLVENNIYLGGRVTNFKKIDELSNGLKRVSTIIQEEKEEKDLPEPSIDADLDLPREHSSEGDFRSILRNDLKSLKNKIDTKKNAFFSRFETKDNCYRETEDVTPRKLERQNTSKVRRNKNCFRRINKKKTTQFIPKYFRLWS